MKPLLELKNVTFAYHSKSGETSALSDLSFQVERGEFIAIVGPSGCGNPMVSLRKHKAMFRQPLDLLCRLFNGCHREKYGLFLHPKPHAPEASEGTLFFSEQKASERIL